ncbi:hypothetical protein DUI87_08108 [Hirundo rustica rustica]|uniref:Uncharacterized protein n=1 Tax=Hirundo rustica rustica TaxID=333673 RepID=A0A3M0KRX6_HIRRU|nr:hypothetical protein DUI87_08108 [Hirundo rustica rustica]
MIHENHLKFKKSKWKVLYLGRNNPQHLYSLRDEGILSSPLENVLRVLVVDEKQDTRQQCTVTDQKDNFILLCINRNVMQVKGSGSVLLLHCYRTPPGMVHPSLKPLDQERHRPLRTDPEESRKNDQRAGTFCLLRKTEGVGVF